MKHLAWIVLGGAACRAAGTDAAVDSPTVMTGSVYLDVTNIGGRCSVTINDEQPFTSAEQTIAGIVPGQTIPLTASAIAGFTLGLWHHTTHDMGSGDPGTITDQGAVSSASVTLGDTPGCVWICCSSGSGDCPTADQCP